MVKLFSNFDTQAPTKNYAAAVQEFSFDKVVFLRRHRLYFFFYTVLPSLLAGWLLITGIITHIVYAKAEKNMQHVFITNDFVQIIGALIIFYLLLFARSKYFNYTLDYTIITPSYISSYDQQGFFNRNITTIEPSKIKTVNFSSRGLINSFFNFGKVDILLEGDDEWKGEIIIDYIYDPETVKKKIIQLLEDIENNYMTRKE